MRKQVFIVEIETNDKDGCGERIPATTEGDIRRALMKGLKNYDRLTATEWKEDRSPLDDALLYKAM